jgi:hypothetical protein
MKTFYPPRVYTTEGTYIPPKIVEPQIDEYKLFVSGKKPIRIYIEDESTSTDTQKGEHMYIEMDKKKEEIVITDNGFITRIKNK